MKWFRFYSEAMHDAKLLKLSDELFRFWVSILCVANDGNPRGTLPSIEDIGIVMRVKPARIERMISHLLAVGLIDRGSEGTLRPHGWDSRQQRGDDAAAIKRNQRDKHKSKPGQSSKCPPDVHGQSTDSPENVHPRARSDSDPDLDTDCPSDRTGGGGSHQECVELAMELFPEKDQIANAVARSQADLTKKLEGPDGRPWWDAFAAGLRLADRMRRRKGADPIDSVIGLALSKAQEWIVLGEIPPDPVGADTIASPRNGRPAEKPAPVHEEHRAAPDSKFHKHSRSAFKPAKD